MSQKETAYIVIITLVNRKFLLKSSFTWTIPTITIYTLIDNIPLYIASRYYGGLNKKMDFDG